MESKNKLISQGGACSKEGTEMKEKASRRAWGQRKLLSVCHEEM